MKKYRLFILSFFQCFTFLAHAEFADVACTEAKKHYDQLQNFINSSQALQEKQNKIWDFYKKPQPFLENIKELRDLLREISSAEVSKETAEKWIRFSELAIKNWGDDDPELVKDKKKTIAEYKIKRDEANTKLLILQEQFDKLNVQKVTPDFIRDYYHFLAFHRELRPELEHRGLKAILAKMPACLSSSDVCVTLEKKLLDFKLASEALQSSLNNSDVGACLAELNEYSYMLNQFKVNERNPKRDDDLRKLSKYYEKHKSEYFNDYQVPHNSQLLTQLEQKLYKDKDQLTFMSADYVLARISPVADLEREGKIIDELVTKNLEITRINSKNVKQTYNIKYFEEILSLDQSKTEETADQTPESWLEQAKIFLAHSREVDDYMNNMHVALDSSQKLKNTFLSNVYCDALNSKEIPQVEKDLKNIQSMQTSLNSLKANCDNNISTFRNFKKEINQDDRKKTLKLKETYEEKIFRPYQGTTSN